MKKIVVFALWAVMLLLACPFAFAAVGDVAGQYYYTDIVTYLNGVEIDSINVGGETLISAEDMQYYSFWVQWYPKERQLKVKSLPHAENGRPPAVQRTENVVGAVRGVYYETDIITYLDGNPIRAYNVGGRTYMHAEEMRNFGYSVEWHPDERLLLIVSPDRTGYVYDVPLSFGTEKQKEAMGNAKVSYQEGKRSGQGDADYFDLVLSADNSGYTFRMSFYQGLGLYASGALQEILNPLVSNGYGMETPLDPKDKYDLVNQQISILINGEFSRKIAVEKIMGNGHLDYYFHVADLPKYKEHELREISFSLGQVQGEAYDIDLPHTGSYALQEAVKQLKKNPLDFMKTHYETEAYFIIYMRESKSLGEVADRLYLVERATGIASGDMLAGVRNYEGFNQEILRPFAFSFDVSAGRFFFSCAGRDKTGDFYIDMETKAVYKR